MLDSKKQVKDMNEAEQLELVNYWTIQWDLVKELREAKDYVAALKVLDGIPEDKKAGTKQVFGWLNHPKSLFRMPYGIFEKNFILEDDKKYGAATIGWNNLMNSIQKEIGQNPKMKQAYFDAYFYGTRTLHQYGLNDPAAKDKDKVFQKAAKRIVDLEFSKSRDGWELVGDRFRKLLKQQPGLNKVYLEQFLDKAGRQANIAANEKNAGARAEMIDSLAKRLVEFEASVNRDDLAVVAPRLGNIVAASKELKTAYDDMKKNR
jgi:hypothetical protein